MHTINFGTSYDIIDLHCNQLVSYVASNVNIAVNSRSFLLWCWGLYLDFFFWRPFHFSFWKLLETLFRDFGNFLELWISILKTEYILKNQVFTKRVRFVIFCSAPPCRMEHPSTSTLSNRRCHSGDSLQPTVPLQFLAS